MKQNRRIIKGGSGKDYLVVHEGLQNSPDIKGKLTKVAEWLHKIAENESSHLSDIGFQIKCQQDELEKLSKLAFERHKTEQESI